MLRGAGSELEQLCNYMCSVGTKLHEAIRSRNADSIKSYRRALKSGVAQIQEAAAREAGARDWDPDALEGMLQEAEESTSGLLQEAEQMLQELEEEARDSWEDRAAHHHASRVINLAGEASKALDETRWSRRYCTEYQDELDWEMRAFRRLCSKLKPSEMPSKMKREARLQEKRVHQEFHRATRILDRNLRIQIGRPGAAC
jgi:hypothetical protein